MKLFIAFTLALSAMAQPGLDVPHVGLMVDHSGALRTVTGIAQNFIAGAALRTDAVSAACSRSLCLVKTLTSLLTTTNADDPGVPVPPGPALFSLRGERALMYFPAARQFAQFQFAQLGDSHLQILDWSLDGEVLALRFTLNGPQFAVRREDGTWIITLDGSIQGALPPATVAVLLLDGSLVYSDAQTLVVRRSDGSEVSFDLSGVVSLSQLSDHYVQISTSAAIYALRIDLGREQLSLLPDAGLPDAGLPDAGVSQ